MFYQNGRKDFAIGKIIIYKLYVITNYFDNGMAHTELTELVFSIVYIFILTSTSAKVVITSLGNQFEIASFVTQITISVFINVQTTNLCVMLGNIFTQGIPPNMINIYSNEINLAYKIALKLYLCLGYAMLIK